MNPQIEATFLEWKKDAVLQLSFDWQVRVDSLIADVRRLTELNAEGLRRERVLFAAIAAEHRDRHVVPWRSCAAPVCAAARGRG